MRKFRAMYFARALKIRHDQTLRSGHCQYHDRDSNSGQKSKAELYWNITDESLASAKRGRLWGIQTTNSTQRRTQITAIHLGFLFSEGVGAVEQK